MNPLSHIAGLVRQYATGPVRLPAPLSWRMLTRDPAAGVQRAILLEYLNTGSTASRLLTLGTALVFWPFRSFVQALRLTRQVGWQVSHVRSRSAQFLQQLWFAWFHGISPAMYYQMGVAEATASASPVCWIQSGHAGLLSRIFRDDKQLPEINDKLLFATLMQEANVSVVAVVAVFENGALVGSRNSLEADLDGSGTNEIFVKPRHSSGGRDALAWRRNESGHWILTGSYRVGHELDRALAVREKREFSTQELTSWLAELSKFYCLLVQRRIPNHPDLRRLFGSGLASVRVLSGMDLDGVRILRAIIYPPYQHSITSQQGFIIDLDSTTGQLGRAFTHSLDLRFFSNHPETGEVLEGVTLPFWREVTTLVRRAHQVLSNYPFLAWDVCISPSGPLLLEANGNFATDNLQKPGSRPLIDDKFLAVFNHWAQNPKYRCA